MQPDKTNSETIDVNYVAHLARMPLSEEEARVFQEQLTHILDHVRTLSVLDVDAVEPTAHAVPVHHIFREDIPTPGLDHAQAMQNAPQHRAGLFIVPRILE